MAVSTQYVGCVSGFPPPACVSPTPSSAATKPICSELPKQSPHAPGPLLALVLFLRTPLLTPTSPTPFMFPSRPASQLRSSRAFPGPSSSGWRSPSCSVLPQPPKETVFSRYILNMSMCVYVYRYIFAEPRPVAGSVKCANFKLHCRKFKHTFIYCERLNSNYADATTISIN